MDIFERLLMNDNPSLYFRNNRKEIYELIPEFKVCDGFLQHNEYHIYDVLEHTLCVLDNVGNDYVLINSASFLLILSKSTYLLNIFLDSTQ